MFNLTAIASTTNVFFENMKTTVSEHSPEILVGVAIVSGIAGVVSAAIGASKVPDIVDEHKEKMEEVREELKDAPKEELAKKTIKIYAGTFVKIIKVFSFAITFEIISICSILAAHNVMAKNNAALAASVASLEKIVHDRDERTVAKFGEEAAEQIRNDISVEEVETEKTDKNGKTKTVKEKKSVSNAEENIFTRYFTRTNPDWQDDEDLVKWFFQQQQNYLNDKLTGGLKVLSANEVWKWVNMSPLIEAMPFGFLPEDTVRFTVTPTYIHDEFGNLEKAYRVDLNCHKVYGVAH